MSSYAQYFGWLGMGIGIATAFIAVGLGGLRNAVLPKWFAVTTTVLGVLALLGACGVPPGGLVNYVLLPFWLIAAADHHRPSPERRCGQREAQHRGGAAGRRKGHVMTSLRKEGTAVTLSRRLQGVLLAVLVTMFATAACAGDDDSDRGAPPRSAPATPVDDVLVAKLTLAGDPDWLATDEHGLWVKRASGDLTLIDLATNEVAGSVNVGPSELCAGIGASFDAIWTCAGLDVVKVDPETFEVEARLAVNKQSVQGHLVGGFNRVWVLTSDGSNLIGIDPKTNETVTEFELPARCTDVALADDALWLPCTIDDRVLKVDPTSGEATTGPRRREPDVCRGGHRRMGRNPDDHRAARPRDGRGTGRGPRRLGDERHRDPERGLGVGAQRGRLPDSPRPSDGRARAADHRGGPDEPWGHVGAGRRGVDDGLRRPVPVPDRRLGRLSREPTHRANLDGSTT